MRARGAGCRVCLWLAVWLAACGAACAGVAGLPEGLAGDVEARGFADLLFTHGALSAQGGDWTAALAAFEQAAATRPEDPTYAYFVALAKLRLGRLDEAVAGLEALLPATGVRLPHGRVQHDLGEAYFRRGDLVPAETSFRAGLKADPRDGLGHFHLGMILVAQGRQDEAFVEFDRAAAVDPQLGARAAYYQGIRAARAGDAEEARRLLARAAGSGDRGLAEGSAAWLGLLDAAAEPFEVRRAELRLGVAAVSDDNPGQLHAQFPLAPPTYGGDSRGEARFRAALNPVIDRRGWTVGLVGQGFAAHHRDFDPADTRGIHGVFQAAWGADPLGFFDGPLGYARVPASAGRQVGLLFQAGGGYVDVHRDPALRDLAAAAGLIVQQGRVGKIQLDALWVDRDYLDGLYEPFDGSALGARLTQTFRLGRPDRHVRLSGSWTDHGADNPGLERETAGAGIDLALPAGRRATFFVSGSRATVDWDDGSAGVFFPFPAIPPPPVAPAPREDTVRQARASVAVALGRHVYLTLEYAWAEREVEPAYLETLYAYSRNVGSAGATVYW